ncbi:hypothetical protein K523DRAFT_152459 [Schizophyllum commune Tattone D]|nr:hypothetical protein K523DRAFT_152459 [Schizophyllum commune Tattone D]
MRRKYNLQAYNGGEAIPQIAPVLPKNVGSTRYARITQNGAPCIAGRASGGFPDGTESRYVLPGATTVEGIISASTKPRHPSAVSREKHPVIAHLPLETVAEM